LPEWLVERGIGEARALLVEDGEIIEARIELDGVRPAGSVRAARLVSTGTNGRNAIAISEGGSEYLLPRGAPGAAQGATLAVEVTREAIPGAEPWKRPLARVTDKPPVELPPLQQRLGARAVPFPAPSDRLDDLGWNDLIDEARSGIVTFAGGELRISPTPAMTLIDVDGYLEADELAILGAAEAARAIRRLDLGGSIGIDLPTATGKAARQRAAAAIDAVLPQPFERTAVNGFGFVQIVRPRQRASLIELAQDRANFEVRVLLRRAAFESPGALRLVANPAVIAVFERKPEWLQALSAQVGGAVGLRAEQALPMSGAYAESV
jgi:hypothetical protein